MQSVAVKQTRFEAGPSGVITTLPLPGTLAVPKEKQVKFTVKDLLAQIKADLWAKEVQTGYTTTYAWLANQLGHFTLGFAAPLLCTWTVRFCYVMWRTIAHKPIFDTNYEWELLFPLLAIVLIIWKENGDVREAIKDAQDEGGVFPMDASDVKRDAYTADYFVILGALTLLAHLLRDSRDWQWMPPVVLICGLPITFAWGRYWLSRKKCFQQADLPMIYRLANFPDVVTSPSRAELVQNICGFVSLRGPWKHLIISGPFQSGKTLLASAIGTEHTFKLGRARYLSFSTFMQIADLSKDPTFDDVQPLWDWRQSNIVIIDDVDVQFLACAACTPDVTAQAIGRLKNAGQLRNRQTVWLVDSRATGEWQKSLSTLLGVDESEMGVVQLKSAKLPMSPRAAQYGTKGLS